MNAPVNPPKLHDCRDAFASTLERLAAENETIVAVCNDSVGSSKLGGFKSKFPDRLVNVGIAEQNMVGVGAGLANGGRLPFVCGAAPFLTGRSLEQIKADTERDKFMSAEEAKEFGLVDEVFEDVASLEVARDALIEEMLPCAPGAIGDAKALVNDFAGQKIDRGLIDETAKRIARRRVSEEGQEGVRAFLARRKPSWAE